MRKLSTTHSAPGYAASLDRFSDAVLAAEPAVEPYTNNFLGSRVRALHNVYPLVLEKLGPEVFAALARVYAQHYPAKEWDLNVYGADFAALLEAQTMGARACEFCWSELACVAHAQYASARVYYAGEAPGGA